MKNLFIAIMAVVALFFTACNGNVVQTNSVEESAAFAELFAPYTALTTALSLDEANAAGEAAKGILAALDQLDQASLSVQEKTLFESLSPNIIMHAEHILAYSADITHQRAHLVALSEDYYQIGKTFGTDNPVYKIYCSMYDDDKGAYWLSESQEVRNPYFGSAMLMCGEVQEELK